ncbi:ubiquitin-protein ligase (E3) [Neophaeococcomyces mojaviensis]|uniref:Ubiquitin-protein ligase (E3) n=1 Tax=Neophaeococcomyces mojaviensis TaxID=3383035 RepID=A0ACC3ADR0_9EURO|nr:ubiquitin-protein ligase (E3) [Knufia sp. JES_112]
MHTSFTGNARRPRQVNLSGRNPNPWASLPGSQKTSQSHGSGQGAVAQAQAERAKRAQDRDRLNAARKVQRVWRGHQSRTQQKQKWRAEWDEIEQARSQHDGPLHFEEIPTNPTETSKYENEAELEHQMRLLIMFLNVHDAMDRWRLCYFGNTLTTCWHLIEEPSHTLKWNKYLPRLSRIVSLALARSTDLAQTHHLLRLGILLLQRPLHLDYNTQFESLQRAMSVVSSNPGLDALVSEYAQALLLRRDTAAYDSFVHHMLSSSNVTVLPNMLRFFSIRKHQVALCGAVSRVLVGLPIDASLWVLANTIRIWRSLSTEEKVLDWIPAISVALSRCANEVANKIDVVDTPMEGVRLEQNVLPLNSFVRQEIGQLPLQESVQYVMKQFRAAGQTVAEVAKPLANYAVALLRAFPSRATNIRMWLYQSSPSPATGNDASSTIQYLWRATKATDVFRRIRNDPGDVVSVLTEAKPPSNQFGYQPPSLGETNAWQEDWRIVLLFLELYTFILKLMDDEEFFALDDKHLFSSNISYQFRQGALPLAEVANLGSFLKNLAFSLYWNAADLAESNEVEDSTTISALFGQSPNIPSTNLTKHTLKTLAGNDVSQSYMKGLATGLLRMLHERDSRRKFLPDNYWLMTRHFELQGFIPAVVAEEERRHEAIGEDEEDTDIQDAGVQDHANDEDQDYHMPQLGSLFNIRAPHIPRTQTSKYTEQLAKQREQARKRRQLQSLNPRLEILRNLPFFIPFDTRVQIFRRFVYRDQERRRNGFVEADDWRMSVATTQARDLNGRHRGMDLIGRHHANIHRGSVFDDAFDQFYDLGEELKEPIQISFIDQFGQPEAGIDGGGVTKEFLMSVTSEAFDPNAEMPLFEENEQRYLYPKPTKLESEHYILTRDGHPPKSDRYKFAMNHILQSYEFLGRIVGKCMYEGILIDVNFAGFFLLKWALTGGSTTATNESAFRASINDLRDFDDQLYQGLLKLKNYTGDVETDFGLNFTVTDTFEVDGKTVSVTNDLLPNGSNTPVTNQNRLKYIDRMTRYRLQDQPRHMTRAFLKGLGQIISPLWLAMFNQKELQKLVGGDNTELDILDLRRNTQYGGLYVIGDDGLEHPTVALFWKVLKEMDDEDRRKVLKFVTSTPRAPLLGFSHLNPKFSIRDSSEDQTRLPSTSTCVNLLKLPRYSNEKTMREKLLYAANSGAGFDLS